MESMFIRKIVMIFRQYHFMQVFIVLSIYSWKSCRYGKLLCALITAIAPFFGPGTLNILSSPAHVSARGCLIKIQRNVWCCCVHFARPAVNMQAKIVKVVVCSSLRGEFFRWIQKSEKEPSSVSVHTVTVRESGFSSHFSPLQVSVHFPFTLQIFVTLNVNIMNSNINS